MNIFKTFGNELSYKDIIELDGAFSVAHVNYGKSPIFNGIDSKNMAKNSRKNSLLSEERVENIIERLYSFNGTEENFKKEDRILLWKNYWLEYINAFDKLIDSLPNSIVTIHVGRQSIEIGFKYLLLKKIRQIFKIHDLKELSNLLYSEYNIKDSYMDDVDSFCRIFCRYIEGKIRYYNILTLNLKYKKGQSFGL